MRQSGRKSPEAKAVAPAPIPPNLNVPAPPDYFTEAEAKCWSNLLADMLPEFINPSCMMLIEETAVHAAMVAENSRALRQLKAKRDTSASGRKVLQQMEHKHAIDTKALGVMMGRLRLTPQSRIGHSQVEKSVGHRRPSPWIKGKLPMQQNGYAKED